MITILQLGRFLLLAPKHTRTREVFAKFLPLNRILVETDAPSMPLPETCRQFSLPAPPNAGRAANHPANIAVTYGALAGIRGLPISTLAEAVEENLRLLFNR